jgi:hypothetical protein
MLLPRDKRMGNGKDSRMTNVSSSVGQDVHVVVNARKLRDYGLFRPLVGFPELVSALRGFDARPIDDNADAFEKLQIAFANSGRSVDPETLNALLSDELPLPYLSGEYATKTKFLNGLSATVVSAVLIGFFFLTAALHFTRATIEASALIAKMDDILAVDFQARIDTLVGLLRSIEKQEPVETGGVTTVDVDVMARTAAETLGQLEEIQYQFNYAEAILQNMRPANARFGYDAPRKMWFAVSQWLTPATAEARPMEAVNPADEGGAAEDPTITNASAAPDPGFGSAMNSYSLLVEKIRKYVYPSSDRAVSPLFKIMAYELERDGLMRNVELTNKWTLPVIYGALGAVLYVLARHFNPFVSSLSFARVMLRITFAMFVAVTISMLLVPTRIIVPELTTSPTLVFLLCFVAGYSSETFIRFLSQLNAYFAAPTFQKG